MPNYDFQCTAESCLHSFELNVPISKRDDEVECKHCLSPCRRKVTAATFNFAEGDRQESSRTDNFWENAERERLKKQAKQGEKVMEQSYYNDPACPEKYKDIKHYADKNDKKLNRETE